MQDVVLKMYSKDPDGSVAASDVDESAPAPARGGGEQRTISILEDELLAKLCSRNPSVANEVQTVDLTRRDRDGREKMYLFLARYTISCVVMPHGKSTFFDRGTVYRAVTPSNILWCARKIHTLFFLEQGMYVQYTSKEFS